MPFSAFLTGSQSRATDAIESSARRIPTYGSRTEPLYRKALTRCTAALYLWTSLSTAIEGERVKSWNWDASNFLYASFYVLGALIIIKKSGRSQIWRCHFDSLRIIIIRYRIAIIIICERREDLKRLRPSRLYCRHVLKDHGSPERAMPLKEQRAVVTRGRQSQENTRKILQG